MEMLRHHSHGGGHHHYQNGIEFDNETPPIIRKESHYSDPHYIHHMYLSEMPIYQDYEPFYFSLDPYDYYETAEYYPTIEQFYSGYDYHYANSLEPNSPEENSKKKQARPAAADSEDDTPRRKEM